MPALSVPDGGLQDIERWEGPDELMRPSDARCECSPLAKWREGDALSDLRHRVADSRAVEQARYCAWRTRGSGVPGLPGEYLAAMPQSAERRVPAFGCQEGM